MRATDLIRNVLDLLDGIDEIQQQEPNNTGIDAEVHVHQNDEEPSRFKQILAMLNAENNDTGPLSNSPNISIAPVDSVTTDAGGGVNGPKDPADIRVKDPGAY
jgi:hypothetical protein